MMKWCIVLLGGLAIVHGQTAPTINADGEAITVDATDLVRAAHFATKRNLGFYPTYIPLVSRVSTELVVCALL